MTEDQAEKEGEATQSKKLLIPRDSFEKVMGILSNLYPKLFLKEKCLPLKKGIDKDILADKAFAPLNATLKRVLIVYTQSIRYLKALVKTQVRYDLNGEVVEQVAPSEIEFSKMLLASKSHNKKAEPIIVVRNGKKQK